MQTKHRIKHHKNRCEKWLQKYEAEWALQYHEIGAFNASSYRAWRKFIAAGDRYDYLSKREVCNAN